MSSIPFYIRHPAFLPSFSLSLLYLTVLSFSGQMVTYLMSVGYTPLHVGIARTGSTIVELSATWVAPRLIRRIGPIRGGLWSLNWQMACLAIGVCWYMIDLNKHANNALISATVLAICVAFSRLGLWGYDLCAQSIVQEVKKNQSSCPSSRISLVLILEKNRKSKLPTEGRFPQQKQHFRTSLNFSLLHLQSPSPNQISFSGPC